MKLSLRNFSIIYLYVIYNLLYELGYGHAVKLCLCSKCHSVGKYVWGKEMNVVRGDEIAS